MTEVIEDIAGANPASDTRIELCWPDGGNWRTQIQRSFVVGDTLWTLSLTQLQANALDGLDLIGSAVI